MWQRTATTLIAASATLGPVLAHASPPSPPSEAEVAASTWAALSDCSPSNGEAASYEKAIARRNFDRARLIIEKYRDCNLKGSKLLFDRESLVSERSRRKLPTDESFLKSVEEHVAQHRQNKRQKAARSEFLLGTIERLRGNYNRMIEHYERAIELDPHNPTYQLELLDSRTQ